MKEWTAGEAFPKAEFYRAAGERPGRYSGEGGGRHGLRQARRLLHRLEAMRERAAYGELFVALAQHDHWFAAPVAIDVVVNHAAGRGDSEHVVSMDGIARVLETAMDKVRTLLEHIVPLVGDR